MYQVWELNLIAILTGWQFINSPWISSTFAQIKYCQPTHVKAEYISKHLYKDYLKWLFFYLFNRTNQCHVCTFQLCQYSRYRVLRCTETRACGRPPSTPQVATPTPHPLCVLYTRLSRLNGYVWGRGSVMCLRSYRNIYIIIFVTLKLIKHE